MFVVLYLSHHPGDGDVLYGDLSWSPASTPLGVPLPPLCVCLGQDELIMTYECRLREALDQDRRLAAAVVTSQRRQLTAGQLTAECDRLRAELERLRADHETQLRENELNYQQGLASYRQLIENNVSR